jgi:Sulfotransferase family
MPDPLIILSPPRSFSSVVSTMIGEHPQLYGFPELHLFAGGTVEDIILREARRGAAAPPGLARLLAQEHDGIQTTKTVIKAISWFRERRHWPTRKLYDYLLELVSPKIAVEKSPVTVSKTQYLDTAYSWYPRAYFLHLTRHPVSAQNSMQEFYSEKEIKKDLELYTPKYLLDGMLLWADMHRRIIDFTSTLSTGQVMRVKGEDVLSEPDRYLPQIAEWLGLSTAAEAIEAMKHPENSPYAHIGPQPVPGGNDEKFIRSPKLRSGRVKEPSLKAYFENHRWEWADDKLKSMFEENNIETASVDEVSQEVTRLAHLLGYQ